MNKKVEHTQTIANSIKQKGFRPSKNFIVADSKEMPFIVWILIKFPYKQ